MRNIQLKLSEVGIISEMLKVHKKPNRLTDDLLDTKIIQKIENNCTDVDILHDFLNHMNFKTNEVDEIWDMRSSTASWYLYSEQEKLKADLPDSSKTSYLEAEEFFETEEEEENDSIVRKEPQIVRIIF